jgi:mediator of RNA polymerase II transcription subunit 14
VQFLEDFINGGEIELLLDCIRLTAGPLHALSGAIRPARLVGTSSAAIALIPSGFPTASKTNELMVSQESPQNTETSTDPQATGGITPSSLLPTDVSVVLRSPYWIRIIYRKNFAVDMRCFAGDRVWLQPAIPPEGGPAVGGSMPCPQFQEVILKHDAAHNAEIILAENLITAAIGAPVQIREQLDRQRIKLGNDSGYGGGWVPLASLKNVLRDILNYLGVLWLFSQLVDILRSILKEDGESLDHLDFEGQALRFRVRGYLFAVRLGSVQHQPQLHLQVLSVEQFNLQQQPRNQTISPEIDEICDFFNLERLPRGQPQQQPRNQTNSGDQLNSHEIREIRDFFSRRVASEPYDASRVASFITLLLLPISILREFLKLITWKKGIAQRQGADTAPSQRTRVELCLGSHIGSNSDALMSLDNAAVDLSDKAASADNAGLGLSDKAAKSNIHYDRPHNAVDFELIIVPDPACMPRVNAASGAGWLPHCVSVRLKYAFGENPHVSLLSMEGSHRGCASGPCTEDWERCKQKVAKAVEIAGRRSGVCGSSVDVSRGRLRLVAETLQHSLQSSLFQL